MLSDSYLKRRYESPWKARIGGINAVYERIKDVVNSGAYDLVWLQREALPWLPPFLESWLKRRSIPYVVDYDDAIFHRYDAHSSVLVRSLLGGKIDSVMKNSTVVVAGNDYLKKRAEASGAKRVVKIPTVIDSSRYDPRTPSDSREPLVVGWIGTPVTAKFLKIIEEPLREVATQAPVKLVTIGSGPYSIEGVDVENVEWTEESEVAGIKRFDVGVMPLEDGFWERGKCGYKIIQYMACAVPAIASPVGVNTEIIDHGHCGWLAGNGEEWTEYLKKASQDRAKLAEMGKRGRLLVDRSYSIDAAIEKLVSVFEFAAQTRKGG